MARYLLDTNIFTFLATDEEDCITEDVRAILQDYENEFLMSMESVRELIVAYRAGKVISKFFSSSIEFLIFSLIYESLNLLYHHLILYSQKLVVNH